MLLNSPYNSTKQVMGKVKPRETELLIQHLLLVNGNPTFELGGFYSKISAFGNYTVFITKRTLHKQENLRLAND